MSCVVDACIAGWGNMLPGDLGTLRWRPAASAATRTKRAPKGSRGVMKGPGRRAVEGAAAPRHETRGHGWRRWPSREISPQPRLVSSSHPGCPRPLRPPLRPCPGTAPPPCEHCRLRAVTAALSPAALLPVRHLCAFRTLPQLRQAVSRRMTNHRLHRSGTFRLLMMPFIADRQTTHRGQKCRPAAHYPALRGSKGQVGQFTASGRLSLAHGTARLPKHDTDDSTVPSPWSLGPRLAPTGYARVGARAALWALGASQWPATSGRALLKPNPPSLVPQIGRLRPLRSSSPPSSSGRRTASAQTRRQSLRPSLRPKR